MKFDPLPGSSKTALSKRFCGYKAILSKGGLVTSGKVRTLNVPCLTLLKKLKMNRKGPKNAKKIKIKDSSAASEKVDIFKPNIKNLCVLCPTRRLRSAFAVSLYLFS